MKTVSKRDEHGVEDEECRIRCRRDEDGGVRTRWMKTVACMLEEDGGMYNDEEGEDGACRLERNAHD